MRRSSLSDFLKIKSDGGVKVSSAFGSGGQNFPSVAQNLSSKIGAAQRAAMNLHAFRRRSRFSPGISGGGGEDVAEQLAPCQEARDGEFATSAKTGRRDMPQRTENVNPAATLGMLLQRASRGVGEGKEAEGFREKAELWEEKKEEKDEEEGREEAGEEEKQSVVPAVHRDSHFDVNIFGKTVKPMIVPSVAEPSPAAPNSRASGVRVSADNDGNSHRQLHQNGQRGGPASEASPGTSFVGDNFSTTLLHQKGSIIVYVPHSPSPGVWAASVEYDGDRDVSWVLAEALRMYEREHSPVEKHAGLARRPRLVEVPSNTWGLFQKSNSKEWQQSPALSLTSTVVSVLRPGEELVVLVDGYDPTAAFSRRPSVVASPPTQAGGGGGFADCRAEGSRLFSDERGHLSMSLPRPSPAELRGGRGGSSLTREDEASDGSRASSDGARRFAGIDESVGVKGGSTAPRHGEMDARGDIGGSGVGYVDVIAKGGTAPGATGTEDCLGMRFGDFDHIGPTRNREANSDETFHSSDDEDHEDNDDDDSLTAEEDEEEGGGYFHYGRYPFDEQEESATRQGGGGGGAWLGRNNSYGGSPPQSRNNVSVTTRGLAERCEEGDEIEGSGTAHSQQPDRAIAAGGEHGDQRWTGEGFPERRSPPRSLVSEMFSAWGGS